MINHRAIDDVIKIVTDTCIPRGNGMVSIFSHAIEMEMKWNKVRVGDGKNAETTIIFLYLLIRNKLMTPARVGSFGNVNVNFCLMNPSRMERLRNVHNFPYSDFPA